MLKMKAKPVSGYPHGTSLLGQIIYKWTVTCPHGCRYGIHETVIGVNRFARAHIRECGGWRVGTEQCS